MSERNCSDYTAYGYFKGRYHVGSDSVHGLDPAGSTQFLNAEFTGLQGSVITVSNNGDLRRTTATINATGDMSCKSLLSTDNDVWSGKPQGNLIVGSTPNTTVTGGDNVLIGQAAGAALTTCTNNIFIGNQCNSSVPTLSNQIATGSSAFCDGPNQICLGGAAVTEIRSNSDNVCNLGSSGKRFSNVVTNTLKNNQWLSVTNTAGIQLADTTACPVTLTGSDYDASQNGKVLSLLNGVMTPIVALGGGSALSGTFTEFRVQQSLNTESNVSLYIIKVGKMVTISIPQPPQFQANADMFSYICSHSDLQPAHLGGVTNGTTTVEWARTIGSFYLKHSSTANWPVGSMYL